MSVGTNGRPRVFELLITAALAAGGNLPAFATEMHRFDIPIEDATEAIRDFAAQANVPILVDGENVKGKHLQPLLGEYSTDTGLKLLLTDSGLKPQYVGDHSIALVPVSHSRLSVQAGEGQGGNTEKQRSEGELTQSIWDRFRLARATEGVSGENPPAEEAVALQEVIVTAQKRQERLQDVPIPVSVLSTQALAERSELLLTDYYEQIPSLTIYTGTQSKLALQIRGLPTTTVLLDDVPISGATPNIDPGNLASVEILRGPQGTLYGASGLGGVLKFVTSPASTDAFSGRLEAGADTVHYGYDLGYNVRGSANIPLTQDLAVRVSSFWRQDAGYIDNPFIHVNGINRDAAEGGTLAALWSPADNFSLKVNYLYQQIQGGYQDVDTKVGITGQPLALGSLQQSYVAGVRPYFRSLAAASLILKGKVGDVELTSLTGWNRDRALDDWDLGSTNAGLAEYVASLPKYAAASEYFAALNARTVGFVINTQNDQSSVSQELRLETPLGKHFDLFVGAYFSRQPGNFGQQCPVSTPTTGVLANNFCVVSFDGGSSTEYAAFTDLTFKLNDRFDIQVGGRLSHLTQIVPFSITGDYSYYFTNPGSYADISPTLHSHSTTGTYLFAPRYKLTDDWMIYARVSSGFSPGGGNGPRPGVPAEYGPEKTKNYEIGTKGEFFAHTFSVDASVYRIDFVGIQQPYEDSEGVSYTANAGAAKSQGVELELEARPLQGLKVSTWMVLSDAHLTDIPYGVACVYTCNGQQVPFAVGDQLPLSARFSANADVEDEFAITGSTKGIVGATLSYMGERSGNFLLPRQVFPAYAKTDLRAGVRTSSWTVNLYATNLLDRRGIISGDEEGNVPYAYFLLQPRTIGVSVVKIL